VADEERGPSGRDAKAAYPNGEPDYLRALSSGRRGPIDDPQVDEMRKNRRVNSRLASAIAGSSSGAGAQISFATTRMREPIEYWRRNNVPWDIAKPDDLKALRQFCRDVYRTHPIVGSVIDIYSQFPLLGMEFTCKDAKIKDFYTDLFMDEEGLNYGEYLIDVSREYYVVGEAWPLGSFNDTLGVWDQEELLDPDDIDVIKSPFLREPRFEMKLPADLRNIILERSPKWEFEQLMRAYPELAHFTNENAKLPVSSILLKQIKHKLDTFHPRGIPRMYRAFRPLMQEEMLNAAQDAVADRLYTPLLLARLGASATDLGTTQPWIPTQTDLQDFEEALDAAMAGDFRVLVHHFALQLESVFGREIMPPFNDDFDRLTERILQVWGMSKTMLSGAGQGETYAADAINRDLISMILTTHQKLVKRFVRNRCLVVAEAQEHFDYEERSGKRYVVMEEVLEVDEETGEERIVEQPKLLVPDLKLRDMNMKNEDNLRQFLEALRASGVPISMKSRLVNVPITLEDEMETCREEAVEMALEEQRTRKEQYLALTAEGLPVDDELKADFEPQATVPAPAAPMIDPATGLPVDPATGAPVDTSMDAEGDPSALVPPPGMPSALVPPDPTMLPPKAQTTPAGGAAVIPLPRNRQAQRPEESDEQRGSMPKPAVLRVAKMRTNDDGQEVEDGEVEVGSKLAFGPRHVGRRRHIAIDPGKPLDETRWG
jgi:hypothetical protein